jgi:hypothetical protein
VLKLTPLSPCSSAVSPAYVSQLSDTLTPEKLQAAGLKVIVVGCGTYEPIPAFRGKSIVPVQLYRPLFESCPCVPWCMLQDCWSRYLFAGPDNFGVSFPVYADPSPSALFQKLGCSKSLEQTPKGQAKKSYIPKSAASEIFASIKFGLSNFRILGKTGDIK